MPRKGPPAKRELGADPIYGSQLVTQLINKVMLDGKKSIAEKIVYSALDVVRTKSGMEAVPALKKAVDNARPLTEVRSRRVGGATYPVPHEVSPRRGTSLAIRWIVGVARDKKGQPMADKLASELLEALQGAGSAVRKREDVHRQAEANRAFAHYRW